MSKQDQQTEWEESKKYINEVLHEIRRENLVECFKKLSNVNLLRCTGLFTSIVLSNQCKVDKATVYAGLITLINEFVPSVGYLCAREAALRLIDGVRREDKQVYFNMASLLAFLIKDEVVTESIAFAVIYYLLERCETDDIVLICTLLSLLGKQLREYDIDSEEDIFEKLRKIYQDQRTDKLAFDALERIFDMRRLGYQRQVSNINLPEINNNTHDVVLHLKSDSPSYELEAFQLEADPSELNIRYDGIIDDIAAKYSMKETDIPVVQDRTDSTNVAFKKKIYLIVKGSLSGDEAAHKLLKLRIKDDEKVNVAEILIKSCAQESTYSKFYGIIVERLCAVHKSWVASFTELFKDNYTNAASYEPSNIRNIGKLWGHALATNCIDFSVFEIVHMNERESNAANRVFLKFIFQELVADIGIVEVERRFSEPKMTPFFANIFPKEDKDDIMFSINYFTAIGLGALTDSMRERLEQIQESEREIHRESIMRSNISDMSNSRTPRMHPDRFRRNRSRSPVARRNRSRTPPRRRR